MFTINFSLLTEFEVTKDLLRIRIRIKRSRHILKLKQIILYIVVNIDYLTTQ